MLHPWFRLALSPFTIICLQRYIIIMNYDCNATFFSKRITTCFYPHLFTSQASNPYLQGIWRTWGISNVPHVTLTFWVTFTPIAWWRECLKIKKWGRCEGGRKSLTCLQPFVHRPLRGVMWVCEGHFRQSTQIRKHHNTRSLFGNKARLLFNNVRLMLAIVRIKCRYSFPVREF